jgi:hypothetical protein
MDPMHGLDVVGRPLLAQLTPEVPLLRAAPVGEAATLQEGGGPTDLARQVRAGAGIWTTGSCHR